MEQNIAPLEDCDVRDKEKLAVYRYFRRQWIEMLNGKDAHAISSQIYELLAADLEFRTICFARKLCQEACLPQNGMIHNFLDRGFFAHQVFAIGHQLFDELSKVDSRKRDRDDRIHSDYFKKLRSHLDSSKVFRTYANKALAHAADPSTRKGTESFTFEDLDPLFPHFSGSISPNYNWLQVNALCLSASVLPESVHLVFWGKAPGIWGVFAPQSGSMLIFEPIVAIAFSGQHHIWCFVRKTVRFARENAAAARK